jgi:two-component system NarL family response regulator
MTLRVLIADDHAVVADGIRHLLSAHDFEVVASVGDGAEAVRLADELKPDLILLDIVMPQLNGVDAITAIRAQWPGAQVIVLTTYDGDEDIYRALQAGAQAYLLKDTPRAELLEAIRAVARGQKRIAPKAAARLVERIGGPTLTEREVEVLRLMADGGSNKLIGAALHISEGTVKFHVNNILGKLGVDDRTQAVTVALQRGIIHLD